MNFDIAAQSTLSSPEHAAQSTPSSPEQSHTELENISFRVHEKAGFGKSGVSPARGHRLQSNPEQRRAEQAATPSLKTYRFACTRRPLLENMASRLHGSTSWLVDSGEHFPDARTCTHFDAEVRQYISTPRPRAAQAAPGSPEQPRAAPGSPEQPRAARHTELLNIWFCVHEKAGFGKSRVPP